MLVGVAFDVVVVVSSIFDKFALTGTFAASDNVERDKKPTKKNNEYMNKNENEKPLLIGKGSFRD